MLVPRRHRATESAFTPELSSRSLLKLFLNIPSLELSSWLELTQGIHASPSESRHNLFFRTDRSQLLKVNSHCDNRGLQQATQFSVFRRTKNPVIEELQQSMMALTLFLHCLLVRALLSSSRNSKNSRTLSRNFSWMPNFHQSKQELSSTLFLYC